MQILIKPFQYQDFHEVLAIYEEGINTGIATFETQIPSWRVWNSKYLEHSRLVAKKDHKVVGFAVLSKTSNREVYRGVAEVSIYVTANSRGQTIGTQLLNKLIEESEMQGCWTLQASIFPQNKQSITLHKNCGFVVVGMREKIAQLHGNWFDNVLLERRSKKNV